MTPPDDDKADSRGHLPGDRRHRLQARADAADGNARSRTPRRGFRERQWTVNPVFRGGADGIDQFNAAAAQVLRRRPGVPGGRPSQGPARRSTLDGEVLSAPTINNPTFSRDQIEISGSFTEDEAKALAVSLRYGSLPIELKPQQAETVSATLGEGALQAGIIAGIIGLVLVLPLPAPLLPAPRAGDDREPVASRRRCSGCSWRTSGPPSRWRAWSASWCRSASRSTAPSCSSSSIKEDVRNGADAAHLGREVLHHGVLDDRQGRHRRR